MKKIRIYTDGACRGNPGASSIAFVILDEIGRILKEHSEYVGIGTNNEAEYKALISALKVAKQFSYEVEFYSDSNLLVNQMTGHWRIKHPNIKPLWREALGLKNQLKKVSFKHVPRTNRYIQKVDELANTALDNFNQTDNESFKQSNHQKFTFSNKKFNRTSNSQEKYSKDEARTYPGYLTGSEYRRERSRLNDMVDGFLNWDPNEKVGETENFVIEINKKQKTVLLKEKNILMECPFKLSMNSNEAELVIKQLYTAIERLAKN
jgi:ribonuclease HI